MTPTQIRLVQASWSQVKTLGPAAAVLFYEQLFAINPGLRALFRGDMATQGERLLAMLDAAVKGLDDPARLLPVLQALGRRHAGYGVEPEHYQQVGQALLDTLARGLGPAFSGEVQRAWRAVYGLVSATMLDAATLPA